MKRHYIIGLIIASLILGLIIVKTAKRPDEVSDIVKVEIGNTIINAKVASSAEDLEKGLMGVKQLKQNEGMLFVFQQESKIPFWMANTLIPLDIIWLDKNKKVVSIKYNAPPCTEVDISKCPIYEPKANAMYVLEIIGNESKNLGIGMSAQAKFEL